MKTEKNRKIGNTIASIALALAVLLAVFVCFQVVSNGYVTLCGNSLFRVVTGSMEPTMPVGTIILCKQTPIEQIQQGDIVCYRATDAARDGKIITHRVVEIHKNASGELELETKGDANVSSDSSYVCEENLIGKVTWFSGEDNVLNQVLSFLSGKLGFLGCVAIPILLICSLMLSESVKNIKRELEEAKDILENGPKTPEVEISVEEYREMYERIQKELVEELKHELSAEGETTE